jgi:hypothetical protein
MGIFGDKTMIIAFDKGAVDRGEKHPDHQPEQQQTKKDFISRPNDTWLFNCIFQTFQFNRSWPRSSIPK